jgi:hypothetical protein
MKGDIHYLYINNDHKTLNKIINDDNKLAIKLFDVMLRGNPSIHIAKMYIDRYFKILIEKKCEDIINLLFARRSLSFLCFYILNCHQVAGFNFVDWTCTSVIFASSTAALWSLVI